MKYGIQILFISAFLLIFSCKSEEEEPEIIRPVRFTEIQTSTGVGQKVFSGVTQSSTQMNLSFRVAGILLELNVEEGDRVSKNQLIARIDDADAKITYQNSVTQLENAKVTETYALANMERVRNLYEANNVSLAEYENAKNEFDAAKSGRETAEQTVALRANELSYYNLYAPMNGVIGNKFVEVNENVNAGTQVVSLETESDIEAKVGIPVTYINQVKLGDTVEVKFASMMNKTVTGIVTRISYVTNESSTYPVYVQILEKDEDIRPGIPAEVIFNPDKNAVSHFLVPLVAVGEDDKGHFVFLLKDINENKGKAYKEYVYVIRVTDEGVLIDAPVAEGDLIITAGLSRIKDGMSVIYFPEFKQ